MIFLFQWKPNIQTFFFFYCGVNKTNGLGPDKKKKIIHNPLKSDHSYFSHAYSFRGFCCFCLKTNNSNKFMMIIEL